jgi:hypothetical protein
MVQPTLTDPASTTSPRSILMAPDESTEIVLVRLDGRLASLENSMKRLEGSVQGLAYVDARLYQSEQTAQDRALADVAASMSALKADLGKRIDGAESSNRSTLVLLIGAILSAVLGVLIRLALG